MLRNLKRLRPMVATLLVAFALLLLANAVFELTDQAFASAYVEHVSGDASVSPASEDPFTLFGSEALLVGDYLTPPTLPEVIELEERLAASPTVLDYTFVVTAAARLEVGSSRRNQFLFGVDFADYEAFFPSLRLLAGSYPETGDPAILVQPRTYRALFGTDDLAAHIGSSILLASALTDSFVIREATLAGVYEYPLSETLLDQVALVDADTARALNGYLYTGDTAQSTTAAHQDLLGADLDALFAEPEAASTDEPTSDDPGGRSMLDELDALFATPQTQDQTPGEQVTSTAWNFALLRTATGISERALLNSVDRALGPAGSYEIRDWRSTVGGSAMIVTYVRLLVNIGILFVVFGAAVIAMNAIVLSVLERANEIGAMRAMGASKAWVGKLLVTETTIIVFGSIALGLLIGSAAVFALNASSVRIDNQYVEIMFGGGQIRGTITAGLLLWHVVGGLGLTAFALLYPLVKILRLTPLKALSA